jgi:short-subunit dehydrogenase
VDASKNLVIVSGGSKGIGRALVTRFARAGHPVATCARSAADLATLSEELGREVPGAVLHTLPADLSRPEDCARFAAFVLSLRLPLAVLVHNAGAFLPGRLQDEPTDGTQLRQMLAVNLLSAYDLTLPLLPAFLAQQAGHIFTICSTASITAYPNGIAKHALYGFTRNLRAELLATGVRVTAVLPGATLTASWEGVDLPAERFIRATDVAEAVFGAFALSPQAVVEELLIRPQLGDL